MPGHLPVLGGADLHLGFVPQIFAHLRPDKGIIGLDEKAVGSLKVQRPGPFGIAYAAVAFGSQKVHSADQIAEVVVYSAGVGVDRVGGLGHAEGHVMPRVQGPYSHSGIVVVLVEKIVQESSVGPYHTGMLSLIKKQAAPGVCHFAGFLSRDRAAPQGLGCLHRAVLVSEPAFPGAVEPFPVPHVAPGGFPGYVVRQPQQGYQGLGRFRNRVKGSTRAEAQDRLEAVFVRQPQHV